MGQRRTPSKTTAYALVAALTLGSPAFAGSPDDPWEPANRTFYSVHNFLDHVFFGPVARGYKTVVPGPVRKGLRNLINNLKEPGIAFNDLLQAHPMRAGKTTARFLINSSVGVGGLFDAAYNVGLEHHDNSFGTTAGRYGIQPGPYIFIPFVGPTNLRDLLGQIADTATDPLAWAPFQNGEVFYSRAVVDGLDQRAEADGQLKAIDDMSTDPYASLRSLYEQNRAGQIQEAVTGVAGSAEPQLDNFDDPGAAPTPAAQPSPASPAPDAAPQAPAPGPSSALENKAIDDLLARPLTPMRPDVRVGGALAQVESPVAG